jgi:c-di-GMP-binding flagellar brake protein YcgR
MLNIFLSRFGIVEAGNSSSAGQQERRRYPRKQFVVPAKLLHYDAVPREVQIQDISLGGMSLRSAHKMERGDPCATALDLSTPHCVVRINIWAKVRYCWQLEDNMYQVGIRFIDFDSFSKMHIEDICNS